MLIEDIDRRSVTTFLGFDFSWIFLPPKRTMMQKDVTYYYKFRKGCWGCGRRRGQVSQGKRHKKSAAVLLEQPCDVRRALWLAVTGTRVVWEGRWSGVRGATATKRTGWHGKLLPYEAFIWQCKRGFRSRMCLGNKMKKTQLFFLKDQVRLSQNEAVIIWFKKSYQNNYAQTTRSREAAEMYG